MMCIECQHTDAKSSPAHAKVGLTNCSQVPLPVGHFYTMTFERDCAHFEPAGDEEVEKRRIWLEKQRCSTTTIRRAK